MRKSSRKQNISEKQSGEKDKLPESEVPGGSSENCRCKEVAKKTPGEMLNLVISDLAFWKKTRGKK